MFYLKSFEYLVCLYYEKNFSEAARKLQIAQSSLSVAIQKIEDELGYILFDRSTTPITVTKIGEIYINSIKEMLYLHKQVIIEINDKFNQINNTLTIGMAPTKSCFLTPLLYSKLNETFNGIELRVIERQTDQLARSLLKGEIDLVYTTDKNYDEKTYDIDIVYNERMTLAARKGGCYSKLCKKAFNDNQINLDLLINANFISFEKDQLLSNDISQIFRKLNFNPSININVSSILSSISIAKKDLGVVFIPSSYTNYDDLKDLFDFYYFPDSIYLKQQVVLTRKKQYKTKQLVYLKELLKTIF